jgi:hypothetical protein
LVDCYREVGRPTMRSDQVVWESRVSVWASLQSSHRPYREHAAGTQRATILRGDLWGRTKDFQRHYRSRVDAKKGVEINLESIVAAATSMDSRRKAKGSSDGSGFTGSVNLRLR